MPSLGPSPRRTPTGLVAAVLVLVSLVAGWYAWPREMDGAEAAERALAEKLRFEEQPKPPEMTAEERRALDRLASDLRRDLDRERAVQKVETLGP